MFRLGVDRVGDRIDPKLGSYQLDILFQPVCLRQGANNPELRSFIPDRFVLGKHPGIISQTVHYRPTIQIKPISTFVESGLIGG